MSEKVSIQIDSIHYYDISTSIVSIMSFHNRFNVFRYEVYCSEMLISGLSHQARGKWINS